MPTSTIGSFTKESSPFNSPKMGIATIGTQMTLMGWIGADKRSAELGCSIVITNYGAWGTAKCKELKKDWLIWPTEL